MVELVQKVKIKHPIDARKIAIHPDPFHPNAYIIALPLDSDPSYAWQTLFEQELWSSLDFWDRKVLIVGKELKLVTSPDNLEDKLNWLERVVVGTNKRVEEHNKKAKVEREAKLMDEEAIRANLSGWLAKRVSG